MKFFAQILLLVTFLCSIYHYGYCNQDSCQEISSQDRIGKIALCLEQNSVIKNNIHVRSLDSDNKDYHVRFLKKFFQNTCIFNTTINADMCIIYQKDPEINSAQVVVISFSSTTEKCAEQIERQNKTDTNKRKSGVLIGKLNHTYILKRIDNTVAFLVSSNHFKYDPAYESVISAGKYIIENCFNQ